MSRDREGDGVRLHRLSLTPFTTPTDTSDVISP
jgi:hypothetical protein